MAAKRKQTKGGDSDTETKKKTKKSASPPTTFGKNAYFNLEPRPFQKQVLAKLPSPWSFKTWDAHVDLSTGRYVVKLVDAKDREALVVQGKPGPYFDSILLGDVFFNADGSRLAYAAKRKGMSVVVLDGTIIEPEFEAVEVIGFSEKSSKLAFAAKRGGEWRVVFDGVPDLAMAEIVGTNKWKKSFEDDQRCGRTPRFLPSSDRIVFVGKDSRGLFRVFDGKVFSESFDDVVNVTATAAGVRYLARRGDEWFAVRPPAALQPAATLTEYWLVAKTTEVLEGPRISPDGEVVAWLAKDAAGVGLFVNGEKWGTFDAAEKVGFSPDGAIYCWAERAKECFLFLDRREGPKFPYTMTKRSWPEFHVGSKSHWYSVGNQRVDHVVQNERVVYESEPSRRGAPTFLPGGELAFAVDAGRHMIVGEKKLGPGEYPRSNYLISKDGAAIAHVVKTATTLEMNVLQLATSGAERSRPASAAPSSAPDFGPYCNGRFVSDGTPAADVAFATDLATILDGLRESSDTDSPFYPVAIASEKDVSIEETVRRACAIARDHDLIVRSPPLGNLFVAADVRGAADVHEYYSEKELATFDTVEEKLRQSASSVVEITFEETYVSYPRLRVGRLASGTVVGVVVHRVDT